MYKQIIPLFAIISLTTLMHALPSARYPNSGGLKASGNPSITGGGLNPTPCNWW